MKGVMALFRNPIFLAFIGVVFLSLAIWFLGPMVGYAKTAPLESQYNRVLAIAGMSTMWFVLTLIRFIKARRKNAQMLDSLAEGTAEEDAGAEELAILGEKMQEAVDTLKSHNFSKTGGSRFIYELPWYVIIGPPGAGKTTLLSHSGLDFPLEDTHGKLSVKGLGGTRNCDWWFTDQAVLLDTAGRYTTQDSEASVDKTAWQGFLAMLREKRSRRPINGVLLALSIEDIVTGSDTDLEQIAKTLRTRIDELYNELGIAPPVYLVFTKCDMLAGFSEFFSDLNREEREQAWGHTLDLNEDAPTKVLRGALEELSRRISDQSVVKLQHELSQRNREHIYGFPMQFNFAQQRIGVFLEQLTAQSRLLQPIFFRGMYFSSATQTGSVFDQVIQSVSRSFGINEGIAAGGTNQGRSYFIQQLLRDVVFRESGLAGTNQKTEKRLQRLQWAATACIATAAVGLVGFWSASYFENRSLIKEVNNTSMQLDQALVSLDANSLDLIETNDPLNHARKLAFLEDDPDIDTGLVVKHAGLFQGNKISGFAQSKYDELLIDALLPRLIVRLENQMHAHNTNSEFLFEALKTYQMIGSYEYFDTDSVAGWFNFDIDTNLPPETPLATRTELKSHIARLFRERPFRLSRPLDTHLISQYQRLAANTPLAQRAYYRIKNSKKGELNTHLRLSEYVGPGLTRVFTRADGKSLDQSLQSFYTRTGYRDIFLPASADINRSLAADTWVLGSASLQTQDDSAMAQLSEAVTEQYYNDYIKQWTTLFSNLSMRSIEGLRQASELISLISDTDSPLKRLLIMASEQTTLTEQPSADIQSESETATDREGVLSSLLSTDEAPIQATTEIDPVTTHFATLHRLVAGFETNTSPLDDVLKQLAELNITLLPMAQAPAGTVNTQLNNELAVNMQQLALKADRLAEPLSSIVSGLTNEISDVVSGGFCAQLNTAWKTDVLPFYQRAIRGRYPVNRNGTTDIALQDFGTFFGPGGVLDKFVTTFLTDQVSRTPDKWTWTGKGSSVCLSDNALTQLARADEIRNAFFAQGGTVPSFQFDLVANEIDMQGPQTNLYLDIGGSRSEFYHGPINGATSYSWPSPDNNSQVSLRVEPIIPGRRSSISINGPWSVLRLFEQGQRAPTSNGLRVNYDLGGGSVTLAMRTSSYNPLNSVAVRNFRAPEEL